MAQRIAIAHPITLGRRSAPESRFTWPWSAVTQGVTAGTTGYLGWGGASIQGLEADATWRTPRALSMTRMWVRHGVVGADGALTVALRVNGVDSALLVTIAAGSLAGAVAVSATVTVAADDDLSVRVTDAGAVNASTLLAVSFGGLVTG